MSDLDRPTIERTVGADLVLGILVFVRAVATYRPSNPVVLRARSQLDSFLDRQFESGESEIKLAFHDQGVDLNGSLIGSNFQGRLQARELSRLLRGFALGSMSFSAPRKDADLEALAKALAAHIKGKSGALANTTRFGGIQLGRLPSGGPNSAGPEIQQIAIGLFTGLMSALDALKHIDDAGQTPQLIPLIRHLRLILQTVDERGSLFQLICARRPLGTKDGDTLHCSLRTFEALGFGHSMGLSRTALLTLGLASCLDRMTAQSRPEAIFKRLAPIRSLGDLAPGVITTLTDLESLRTGGRGGRLGQILQLVDTYVSLSQPEIKDAPAPAIWPLLLRVIPSARSLIGFLQSWKGRVPIGSIVQDPELGQCVLLDLSGPRMTPRLSPFDQWGTLGGPVELEEIPPAAQHYFGRSHLLCMPSDTPEGEERPSTTPAFPIEGSTAGPTLGKGVRFGGSDGRRFLVERIVGKGGQALVYQVRDSRLGRVAAAKVSTAHESSKRRFFLERFERELLLSSRVSHPNVLQVYDCGELDGGRPYILQEWMDRGDLGSLIEKAKDASKYVPLTYVKYYATAIASALRSVHDADIVHRDLKPDNVLIRADGVAKLTDFGVAKDIGEEAIGLTEVGQTMGTLGFMAPEQLMGLPGPQSDIFGFAVTVYFMLCGRHAPQERLNKLPRGRILAHAWDPVPASWRKPLLRMTAPELEDRAQNFDEVLELLRQVSIVEPLGREPLGAEDLPPLPSSELGVVLGALPSETGPVPAPEELDVGSEKWTSGTDETIDLPASTKEALSMGKIPILRPSTAEITVEERGPAVPTSTNTALPLPSVDGDQDVSAEDAVKGEAGSEELPIEPPDDTLDLDEE